MIIEKFKSTDKLNTIQRSTVELTESIKLLVNGFLIRDENADIGTTLSIAQSALFNMIIIMTKALIKVEDDLNDKKNILNNKKEIINNTRKFCNAFLEQLEEEIKIKC